MNMGGDNWQAAEWPICLAEPPVLVQMSAGLHGGQSTDRFQLPTLWSLHFYRYRATLELAGQVFPIRPGFVGLTPPNQPVLYRYEGPSPHLYAHFRLLPGTSTGTIPLMQDLGARFPALYTQFEEVALAPHLPRWRRQARLWEILCQLTERPTPRTNIRLIARSAGFSTTFRSRCRATSPRCARPWIMELVAAFKRLAPRVARPDDIRLKT